VEVGILIEKDNNNESKTNYGMSYEKMKQPIEYIVQYEMHKAHEKGVYGIPLAVERTIVDERAAPYVPTHHIPIIGMVSYSPRNEKDGINLQKKIEEAYNKGLIHSYERIERNIKIMDE
jgi:hypothetical protein